MSSRLHLGALWVVSWHGRYDGNWHYRVFTSRKEAAKYEEWVLDAQRADQAIGPRRFVPKNVPVKRDKKAGGTNK